ncbi:Ran-interacting Mog1 protein-domain-containing protein, partial [Entophlyctis helioformis]
MPSTQLAVADRPLYGGAMTAAVPANFVDASQLREVPDHQEVFVDMTGESSMIVELLEAEDGDNVVMSAQRHYAQLADDNDATGPDARVVSVQEISAAQLPQALQQAKVALLVGVQRIAKFRERGEAAKNTVGIYLGIMHLPTVGTDVLVTFNQTIEVGSHSSSQHSVGGPADASAAFGQRGQSGQS